MICRDCDREFDPEHKKTITRSGFIDQCAKCSVKSKDNNIKLYNNNWKGDQQPLSCGLDNIQIVSY